MNWVVQVGGWGDSGENVSLSLRRIPAAAGTVRYAYRTAGPPTLVSGALTVP